MGLNCDPLYRIGHHHAAYDAILRIADGIAALSGLSPHGERAQKRASRT